MKTGLSTEERYPGRYLKDEDRSAYGLGWEYRRRGLPADDCPFKDEKRINEFMAGYRVFQCSDDKCTKAMLQDLPS